MLTQFIGSQPKQEARIWFAGLPGSGKTSAIYKYVLGECVERRTEMMSVIQESFVYRKQRLIFWEIGNIDYCHSSGQDTYTQQMKNIIFQHYYARTELIVFFVDSTSEAAVTKSKQEIADIASMKGLVSTVPMIVFCNKQDADDALDVAAISELIGHNGHTVMGGSVLLGDGIFELLDAAHNLLAGVKTVHLAPELAPSDVQEAEAPKQRPFAIDQDVGNWLEREPHEDDAAFLAKLEQGALSEKFDHFNLVRLCWICHCGAKFDTATKLTQQICDLILKAHAEEYNVTLICFWSQMVLFGLESIRDAELKRKVRADFRIFIACNPTLCNSSNLLKEYYSKQLLFKTMDAPQSFCLPDLKPLPSLITDVETLKKQKLSFKVERTDSDQVDAKQPDHGDDEKKMDAQRIFAPPVVNAEINISSSCDFPGIDDDAVFLTKFERQTALPTHIDFVRAIWCNLTIHPRAEAVRRIVDRMKAMQHDAYHETLTHFWISMIDYFITLSHQKSSAPPLRASFIEFWTLLASKGWTLSKSFKYDLSDPGMWRQFYSDAVMHHAGYKDIDAATQLCVPDKRNLPSAVCYYVQTPVVAQPAPAPAPAPEEEPK